MQVILTEDQSYEGDFKLDLAKLLKENHCKGVLSIEVKPVNRLDTLILNNIPSDLISHKNPYILKSQFPIVSGRLSFKPFKSDVKMKSVVRLLLEQ